MTEARLAFLFAPIDAISVVIQVPIFCPIIIGTALPKVIAPVAVKDCNIPIDADEL
jgi:hypothetical protein